MLRILISFVLVALCWVIQIHSQGPLFSPAPGSPVAVRDGSGQVALADVNGDGNLDMLTRHLRHRLVMVQLGDGTGRFAEATGSPITLKNNPYDLKNILDLAISSAERDKVDIFLGNGKGGFSLAPGSPFTASAGFEIVERSLVELVDINEDGNLDSENARLRPSPKSEVHLCRLVVYY